MTPEQYWKIVALANRAALAQDQASTALNAFYDAMKAAGLDPSKPHRYDDEAQTITLIPEKKTDGNAARKG